MTAISNRMPTITVEYDCYNWRYLKTFDDAYEARRFYLAKEREGKNPSVRRPKETEG